MKFEQFIKKRKEDQLWIYANGFNNGDPETNGEYNCADYFLNHEFGHFLDIGANIGIFSIRAIEQQPSTYIHAFEPNPHLVETLCEIAKKSDRMTVYNMAIGSEEKNATFNVHPIYHETSSLTERSLMTWKFVSQMTKVEVVVQTLDNIFSGDNNNLKSVFLKIDTEGHEFPVIRGAKNILKELEHVGILFEYSFAWQEAGESIEDCFQFLNRNGFVFYRVIPFGLEEMRFITQDMKHIQYCNYVALKGVTFSESQEFRVPSLYGENKIIRL